jgi:hypothetical protein
MNTKYFSIFTLFCIIQFNQLWAQNDSNQDHVQGQLIAQLIKGSSINDIIASVDKKYELKIEAQLSDPLAIWLISFNQNAIAENELLRKINAHPNIKAVQFNHYVQERVLEPNDPSFVDGTQWDMKNTGQNGGLNDADIDAPEAWELCTGGITSAGDTVVMAVVDGGFFINHQDLKFWKNNNEIAGNNIDDDNNGYVDDINGWNAYNNSGNITSSQHGTHVSGTVAAVGNNDVGVVGVNWNGKVLAIQASSGTESIVVAGYAYVFKLRQMYNQSNGVAGAFVVSTNSSFGVNNGNPNNFPIWCGMYDSLGAVGILSAGATANANYNIDATGDMPTACPNNHLITVTNTDRNDVKANSAGYGLTTIDLGAPGSTIYSTTPNNQYANLSGTSMATPHVAGAVGLMISAACPQLLEDYKNYPDSIALIFKQFMLDEVDPISSLQNQTVTGGRLNIHKSLMAINNYCILTADKTKAIAQSFISNLEVQPNPVSDFLQLSYNLPASGNVVISIFDLSGREVKVMNRQNFSEGFHHHIVDVQDLESGIYFIKLNVNNSSSQVKKFIKN